MRAEERAEPLPEQARAFLLEGGAHGILLIHGFTATPALVRPLGDALFAEGMRRGDPPTVQGILLPGHGTRIEDMRATGGYAPWLRAVREAYAALAARCVRVSVVGHSMGGLLALLLAEEEPVYAAVSIASPMRLGNRWAPLSPLLGWVMPYVKDKPKPRREGFLEEYSITYDSTPICRVGDLRRLMREAEAGLSRLRCPLLIVQSRDDRTIRQESAERIHRAAASGRKEILWLERSGHNCTIGPEREKLFAACAAFLLDEPG